MIKYLKILTITLLITTLLTAIYFFISFEIPDLFYNKLQFSLIPGIIYTVIGFKMIVGESTFHSSGMYVSKKLNKQSQKERINANTNLDLERIIIMLAYLTSGIIQIIFGILIGKLGTI